MLNPDAPIPLYRQLADFLRAQIRSGDYPPGSRIPSEHALAAEYSIGRPTVRQATEVLINERLLVRKRGAGTFVRSAPSNVDLFSLAGTLSSFHNKGIPLTTHMLTRTVLKNAPADPENPFSGTSAYFLARVGRVDGEPALIENIYLQAALFKGIERFDLTGQSLSQIVHEHFFMRPIGGTQNFRIGHLDKTYADHLAVQPETPILIVKRYLHFKQAQNAVYAELYCRTDQFIFSQQLGGRE